MRILIRGMEMPTSCEKCPFLDYEQGFCLASGVKSEIGWYELTLCPGSIKNGRHDDCPLVPVPPHGRLIDADALGPYMLNAHYKYRLVYDADEVADAPTVIPPEEDK